MWPNFQQSGQHVCHYLLYSREHGCIGDLAFASLWYGAIGALILALLFARLRAPTLRLGAFGLILAAPFLAIGAWASFAVLPVPFMVRAGSLVMLMGTPLLIWFVGSWVMFMAGGGLRRR